MAFWLKMYFLPFFQMMPEDAPGASVGYLYLSRMLATASVMPLE
jgi:hypothetical protein